MTDYISREAVLSKCADIWDNADETTQTGVDTINAIDRITDFIEAMPATDVQPVKHGYWIKQPEKFQIHEDVINSNYLYSCSCCNASDLHSERANNDGEVKFCWRCGAKMDAEPDEPWQSK